MQLKAVTPHNKVHDEMDAMHTAHPRELNEFNNMFTCRICLGYMIDPTTVDQCYHTYCRSCILKHLLRDVYCPQCKASGGKQINEDNLRSDDTLRALIYKLVPGLYQRELERLLEFERQHQDLDAGELLKPAQEPEFFTLTEPISLSLEYHPAMLKNCGLSDKPPVCYLQCPAGLRVGHLKRFLCSKYDIDAEHKHVEVEVTYEDEVLLPSFTLMDVAYCYQWKRLAPMAFRYRILLHERETSKNEHNLSKVKQDIELSPPAGVTAAKSVKTVTFADDVETQRSHASKARSKSTSKTAKGKRLTSGAAASILATSKRDTEDNPSAISNFKSLRSNDLRYSDFGVSSAAAPSASSTALLRVKSEPEAEEPTTSLNVAANLNIVVSIPQSQLSKAAVYGDESGFELKTANKKTANSLVRNLPKLKIELNSMKSKFSLPKSADARLEETATVQQQLDLETYAKNIGLKPIEPVHVAVAPTEASKHSPNASPLSSSCSSSTNGSNGGTADASTSTHRKRKKKHSKEPKDANGKRKKLHAEISSQTDGKMKMKITTTHNHKSHKLELKRAHSLAGGELVSLNQLQLGEPTLKASETLNVLNRTLAEEALSIKNLMVASSSSSSGSSSGSSAVAAQPAEKLPRAQKELNLPVSPPLPPSLFKAFTPASSNSATAAATVAAAAAKQAKLPQAVTATATAATATTQLQPKTLKSTLNNNNNNSNNNNNRKPTLTPCSSSASLATTLPHFAVPQAPLRHQPAHHMQRYLSTPTSIASAANKQPKRSLSLDESQQQQLAAKQPRLDYHQQQQQQQQQQQLQARLAAAAAAAAKPKAVSYAPAMRLYGPELSKPQQQMPLLCPTSLNLPSSSSVTITPRPRGQLASYAYAESSSSSMPALEIMRLGTTTSGVAATAAAAAAAAARLMGPPVSLPKQQTKRATPPMSLPAMVKSPPLSVALSAQRANNNGNSTSNNSNHLHNNSSNSNNNSNNVAYRTSPPALINLRNTLPLAFPSKSAAAAAAATKAEVNSKKSATVASAAGAANSNSNSSKTNGTTVALDSKSKTSLREFRPPPVTATAAATTTTAAVAVKDADILDLSAAAAGRSSSNSSNSTKLAPNSSSSSGSNNSSLEAALNKIKQNINANSNSNNCLNASSNAAGTATAAAAAAAAASAGGDDLQNLHMLSESATAREKISIKAGSSSSKNSISSNSNSNSNTNSNSTSNNNNTPASNIYENKPKNALVRPQNASVRSIPNPSALAFRNQANLLSNSNSSSTNSNSNNNIATTNTTSTATTAAATTIAVKTLAVKVVEEKLKLNTTTAAAAAAAAAATAGTATAATLLSPSSNNNNNNNNSTNNNNNNAAAAGAASATSPRALKKATTIDQVAANLNIRAEAKAAALAEETPLAAKMPETDKTCNSSSTSVAKTELQQSVATATATAAVATTTPTTAAAAAVATASSSPLPLAAKPLSKATTAGNVAAEALAKPPVQIAATDTLAPLASSA